MRRVLDKDLPLWQQILPSLKACKPLTRVPKYYFFSSRWRNWPKSPLISCCHLLSRELSGSRNKGGGYTSHLLKVYTTTYWYAFRHGMLATRYTQEPEISLDSVSNFEQNDFTTHFHGLGDAIVSEKNITWITNLTSYWHQTSLFVTCETPQSHVDSFGVSNKTPSHHMVFLPIFPLRFISKKPTKCLVAMLPPKPSLWPQRPWRVAMLYILGMFRYVYMSQGLNSLYWGWSSNL